MEGNVSLFLAGSERLWVFGCSSYLRETQC